MKDKQFRKISAHTKLIMMIWMTLNKINSVATHIATHSVRTLHGRHFIGEANLVSNGLHTIGVTMRNNLRGDKAVPNKRNQWIASLVI